jgi:NDP-sugar pyrophosphorylase family protein
MIKALILAGGKGGRLRPLALNTPKPIVPLANIPFLFFQIDHIKHAKITEIILSLSYQPRKITDIFGDGIKYGVTMRYTHEKLPRGTAGAFKAAENLIDDTTIVLNGDVLTETSLIDVLKYHRQKQAEARTVKDASSDSQRSRPRTMSPATRSMPASTFSNVPCSSAYPTRVP